MSAKLTYFRMSGLGEAIRVMLTFGEIPFEDIRLSKEEWPMKKKTLRWSQLPVLEIDGKLLCQSMAINRYLARKLNLAGEDEWEEYQCDMIVDHLDDLRKTLVNIYYKPDSQERTKNLEKARTTLIPEMLKKLETEVAENDGYFVGGKLTWPDIMLTGYTVYLNELMGYDIVKDFPKLSALVKKVSSVPSVAKYLKSRPASPADMRTMFT